MGGMKIAVTLPSETISSAKVALGFQALLLYEEYGSWEFEGGSQYSRAYANLIDYTVDSLVPQITSGGTGADWEPWKSIALVAGTLQRLNGLPLTCVSSFFENPTSSTNTYRSPSWKALQDELNQIDGNVRRLLLLTRLGAKGSAESSQMVDGAVLEKVRRELLINPVPDFGIPPNAPARWDSLRQSAVILRNRLSTAIDDEFELQYQRFKRIRAAMTDGEERLSIDINALSQLLQEGAGAVREAGIPIATYEQANQWETSLAGLSQDTIERLIDKEQQYGQATTLAEKLLAVEDSDLANCLHKLDVFLCNWRTTLSEQIEATKSFLDTHGGPRSNNEMAFERFVAEIDRLITILGEFTGGNDDAN